MAKYRFGGVLKAARWPLLAALQGRTIITPMLDVGRGLPRFFHGTDESADLQVPQIMYCENVVPTIEGVQSVGYLPLVAEDDTLAWFDQAFILRDADENNYIFAPSNGANYILDPVALEWTSYNPVVLPAATRVTRSYVNGRTFVCYAGVNIYEWDPAGPDFLPVTITLPAGVVLADVQGIGSSNNYNILFTDIAVYWSSLVDPLDFTASVTTGAGSAIPQDVKGQIISIQGVAGGFIIWTVKNAVAAQYTNNVRAPFAFKEISGVGGILVPEQATQDTVSGIQYAWTTNGLQKVTLQGSEFISVEVNDFLAGRRYNYVDDTTKTIISVDSTTDEFYVKVSLVSNRFLCISWTDTIFPVLLQKVYTFCLMYDLGLKRWGQFKIVHTDVFDFEVSTEDGGALTFDDLLTQTFDDLGTKTFNDLIDISVVGTTPTSKRTLAFLGYYGSVHIALMDYQKDLNHEGVVVFGRHQMSHPQIMQHQLTTVEGKYATFNALIQASQDGYSFGTFVPMTPQYSADGVATYDHRVTGVNFNLAFTGTFALSSYVTEVTQDGDC